MPYPLLTVKSHIDPDTLKQRYLKCKNTVERTHWHILWLMSRPENPLKATEAAEFVGVSPDWVRKLVRRYNDDGPIALGDGRSKNGSKLLLNKDEQAELFRAITSEEPEGGGLWTIPNVVQWIQSKLKRKVGYVTGWNYLKRLGLSCQTPRPRHHKVANSHQQDAFKKTP